RSESGRDRRGAERRGALAGRGEHRPLGGACRGLDPPRKPSGGGRGLVTEISASLVKELRDRTGAGMMDCKRALQETGGDVEAAQRLLREKGLAAAAKRAGRETTEGKVSYRVQDGLGVIVGVGCETEPVSNNDEFLAFAKKVLEAVWTDGVSATEELDEERQQLAAKLGENIVILDPARFEAVESGVIEAYA